MLFLILTIIIYFSIIIFIIKKNNKIFIIIPMGLFLESFFRDTYLDYLKKIMLFLNIDKIPIEFNANIIKFTYLSSSSLFFIFFVTILVEIFLKAKARI